MACNRVWRMASDNLSALTSVQRFDGSAELNGSLKSLRFKTHATIEKVTRDIEDRFHFNTAISAVMELVNTIYQFDLTREHDDLTLSVIKEAIETVITLLAPICPHIAEELWKHLGKQDSIFKAPWPVYDPEAIVEDEITIVVQINGKLRSRLSVPADATQEDTKERVLSDGNTKKWTEGKEIKKVIVVPKKLVNIVVK